MAFIQKLDGEWVLTRGKHAGEALKSIAEDEPSYLQWMFKTVTENMSDEEFHALEDTMEEFDIEPL